MSVLGKDLEAGYAKFRASVVKDLPAINPGSMRGSSSRSPLTEDAWKATGQKGVPIRAAPEISTRRARGREDDRRQDRVDRSVDERRSVLPHGCPFQIESLMCEMP